MYQPLYQPLKTEGVRLVAGYLYFFLRYWICFQDPLWEFFPPLWLCVRHNGGDLGLWEQMMGKIPTDPDPSIVSDTESLWWEKFPQWILKTDPVPQKKSINSLPLAPHPSVFKSLSNIQHPPFQPLYQPVPTCTRASSCVLAASIVTTLSFTCVWKSTPCIRFCSQIFCCQLKSEWCCISVAHSVTKCATPHCLWDDIVDDVDVVVDVDIGANLWLWKI